MTLHQLERLEPGQPLVYRGNLVTTVSDELAAAFTAGDRVVIDEDTGQILHIPARAHRLATDAVSAAVDAFDALNAVPDTAITAFFEAFADHLADDDAFAPIASANTADIEAARERGRSTTRLELGATMRADMIAGLRGWAALPAGRSSVETTVEHDTWSVQALRAPLGVVGFVFEGRPNVFADAAGVVRTGNTVVFRIGSDALGTARAIVDHALRPALADAGLPEGTVSLVGSAAHAAGWAMFGDPRLALAVARGSGAAVAQLGGVARHAGNPVSLHGTGGAWVIADETASVDRFRAVLDASLDRKVCNTVNTVCVPASRAGDLLPAVVEAVDAAGRRRQAAGRIHATRRAIDAWRALDAALLERVVDVDRVDGRHVEPFVTELGEDELGEEWEWESSPEITVHLVDDVEVAVQLFNRQSPRFVASLISEADDAHAAFYASIDAPFVGDGFTRWVDGQYALSAPELGLSNWEHGRMLGRGGILSGDSVYTVRYRATMSDPTLRR